MASLAVMTFYSDVQTRGEMLYISEYKQNIGKEWPLFMFPDLLFGNGALGYNGGISQHNCE